MTVTGIIHALTCMIPGIMTDTTIHGMIPGIMIHGIMIRSTTVLITIITDLLTIPHMWCMMTVPDTHQTAVSTADGTGI